MLRYAWGIDVGSVKIGLAWFTIGGESGAHCFCGGAPVELMRHHKVLPREQRFGYLRALILPVLTNLAREHPPSAIVVEQPFSPRKTDGALMGSYGVVAEVCGGIAGPNTISIPPPSWKKHAGLGGNAGKPAIAAEARRLGYGGGDQDVADAVVIAHVACGLVVKGLANGSR